MVKALRAHRWVATALPLCSGAPATAHAPRTHTSGSPYAPVFRGRGLSADVLHTLCEYGFALRGLQRLQIETLTENAPMLAAAAKVGFTR